MQRIFLTGINEPDWQNEPCEWMLIWAMLLGCLCSVKRYMDRTFNIFVALLSAEAGWLPPENRHLIVNIVDNHKTEAAVLFSNCKTEKNSRATCGRPSGSGQRFRFFSTDDHWSLLQWYLILTKPHGCLRSHFIKYEVRSKSSENKFIKIESLTYKFTNKSQ